MEPTVQKVLFVPLDDRPCCLDLVVRLASLAGVEVSTPPTALLGNFQQPGQPEKLLEWLAVQPSRLPSVVALDMLCWGGLIASRHHHSSLGEAERNLQRYLALQAAREGPAYAFKTLLRTTPTQLTVEETEQADRIVALSRLGFLLEKAESLPQKEHLARAMEQLKESIAQDFLQRYLSVRQRNHTFDSRIVEAASHFEALLFALDDCQTEGWNLLEKERLERLASRSGQRIDFYPGTDESAGLLLTRLLVPETGIEPVWSHAHLKLTQTRYEDRPLGALLDSQLQAARLRQGRCRRKLFLYGRLGAQKEAAQQADERVHDDRTKQGTMRGFLDRLERCLDAGDSCVVADLAYANGGDLSLVEALLERRLASRLTGYSAWNTAGNTLGTALATLALYPDSPSAEQDAVRRLFLWERFTDDALYQSRFRFRLKRELGAGLVLAGEELETAQRLLREEFHTLAEQLWSRLFPESSSPDFRVELPWSRLFEVKITVAA